MVCFKLFILLSLSVFAKAEHGFKLHKTCVEPGMIALTFDDGPTPNGGTEAVLRVLRRKGVKATFFVTGQGHDTTYLDADLRKQQLLRRIFQEGHQVASHTWSHPYLTKQTDQQIMAELGRLHRTVRKIIGVDMTAFRAPYGDIDNRVGQLIERQFGYDVIHWTLDTRDWSYRDDINSSIAVGYKHYLEAPSISNTISSFISLHHDPVPRSGELAVAAIDYMRMRGYRVVTVAECINAPDYA